MVGYVLFAIGLTLGILAICACKRTPCYEHDYRPLSLEFLQIDEVLVVMYHCRCQQCGDLVTFGDPVKDGVAL